MPRYNKTTKHYIWQEVRMMTVMMKVMKIQCIFINIMDTDSVFTKITMRYVWTSDWVRAFRSQGLSSNQI